MHSLENCMHSMLLFLRDNELLKNPKRPASRSLKWLETSKLSLTRCTTALAQHYSTYTVPLQYTLAKMLLIY